MRTLYEYESVLLLSDDVITHDKIEVLVFEIEALNADCAVVCGDAQFIDNNGNKLIREKNSCKYDRFIDYYISGREDFNIATQFGTYRSILKGNYIPAMSTLIKKEVLVKVGLYEEDLILEDWSMWLKLTKRYEVKFVDKIVAFYRWHDSNTSKVMSKQLAVDVIEILDREKKYCFQNSLHSVWRESYYRSIIFLVYLFIRGYLGARGFR